MQSIVPIAIWVAIIIAIVGVLIILGFGVVSLVRGKTRPLSIAILLLPAVILLVLGLIGMSWAEAAIWTVIAMFVIGLLGLLAGGVRGFVN